MVTGDSSKRGARGSAIGAARRGPIVRIEAASSFRMSLDSSGGARAAARGVKSIHVLAGGHLRRVCPLVSPQLGLSDRKSTRLNSSHLGISYAVFCLKK